MNLFCGHGDDLKKIGPDQFYRFDFYRILTKLSTKLSTGTVHNMLVYFWILVQPSLCYKQRYKQRKNNNKQASLEGKNLRTGFRPLLHSSSWKVQTSYLPCAYLDLCIIWYFLLRFWLVSFILFFSWKYRRQLEEHCSIRSSSLRVYRYTGTC